MEYVKYLIAPIICALIGWFTNYMAIKMLFHPRKPVKILGWTLQGVFPGRRKELAASLAAMVEKELVSRGDIREMISSPEFSAGFSKALNDHLHEFVSTKLTSLHPMLAVFMNGESVESIKKLLTRETGKHLPRLLNSISAHLEKSMDIKTMVQDRIEQFSMDKLEQILFGIMKKELRFIELMGAVLGFAIGIFQSVFIFLL